jgi:hypothetical protein
LPIADFQLPIDRLHREPAGKGEEGVAITEVGVLKMMNNTNAAQLSVNRNRKSEIEIQK